MTSEVMSKSELNRAIGELLEHKGSRASLCTACNPPDYASDLEALKARVTA